MKKNRGVEKGACSSLDPCRCDSSWRIPALCQRQNQLKAKGCHVSQELGLQLNFTLGREVLGVKKW